jgi:hypothetical protein
MPSFVNLTDNDLLTMSLPESNFGYSAVHPDSLGASEYTLVTIAVDVSGSVDPFAAELLAALKESIRACKKSPRSDNLLLRVLTFNQTVAEVHGFVPVDGLDPDAYAMFACSGGTALFDAAYSALGATRDYGAVLARQDYGVNGIAFIITDGEDNSSAMGPQAVRDAGASLVKREQLDSLVTVLIGINAGSSRPALERFRKEAGLTEYIDLGAASAGKLAKLGGFISKSISSQSQTLGSGQAAGVPPLTF